MGKEGKLLLWFQRGLDIKDGQGVERLLFSGNGLTSRGLSSTLLHPMLQYLLLTLSRAYVRVHSVRCGVSVSRVEALVTGFVLSSCARTPHQDARER